jgi:hypothetical protein
VEASFRVEGLKAECWNPFDGTVRPVDRETGSGKRSTIKITLEPYGSRLVVFSRRTLPAPGSNRASQPESGIDISTNWKVTFGARDKPLRLFELKSWTEDESSRYFSGVATYERTLTLIKDLPGGWRLDFGEGKELPSQALRNGMQAWFEAPVREAAVVYINDRRVGSVWCPPYSLDVTGMFHKGVNKVRIMVANTAMNYMAGHSLPDYRLLNLRYGERFQPQDMDKVQPIPSGLLGPITLISEPK